MSWQGFIFELKDHCRGNSQEIRKQCHEYELLPAEEKKSIDWERRCRIVQFAFQNIPYYKDKYTAAGFHPDQLKKPEDWDRVPVVEKTDIRAHSDQFLLPGIDRKYLAHTSTGGSTGTPLHLYKDSRSHFEAIHWRAMEWYGCAPWSNVGIVNRRVPRSSAELVKNRLLWWPTRRCYLDASNVSDATMGVFLQEINDLGIVYLTGYCGCLEHLADYALAHGIQTPTLKMVWSTTSPLRPDVRIRIEKAFGCPVMDQYGCCEFVDIAVQKPGENFLTVNSDFVHVDIVDSTDRMVNVEQVTGDILITDLETTVFPLIKYRLGDCSSWYNKPFTSQDGFPKIAFVQGRITDAVIFPDGGFIDGAYLTTICDAYADTVSSYQVIQDESYNLTLKLVLKEGKTQNAPAVKSIIRNLQEKIGGRCQLNCEYCDFIPDDRGKRRYVISAIALKRQAEKKQRHE